MKCLLSLISVGSCAILTVKAYTTLSDNTLRNIPSPGNDFNIKSGELLSPILIPRVSGTVGSLIVQHHFIDWFSTHLPKWNIEFQNSTSTTPISGDKEVPFVNIIISRDPPWARIGDVGRLVLAAHYDSKFDPPGFIGAIDSAAPCAILMHVARSVDEALTRKWNSMETDGFKGLGEEQGVQIIFLDGEEAFLTWSDTDSLYGSRSLAEVWESNSHPAMSVYQNPLGSISLLVLLDLIGNFGTSVPSYFETTHWAYRHLAKIEQRMRTLGHLKSKATTQPIFLDYEKKIFSPSLTILDDHIPFMARGVEILHLIPSIFPKVWHTMEDTGENLDIPTVEDWAKIITAFTSEWMNLEGFLFVMNDMKWKKEELISTKSNHAAPM